MCTIMDRKSKDLTEAKEIKKRWQEYTEELYIKGSPGVFLPKYKQMPCQSDFDTAFLPNTDKMAGRLFYS